MSNRTVPRPGSSGRLPDELRWSVVVPVKRLAVAKTRLSVLAGGQREQLALAFAADTVAAALATPGVRRVLVVTDDPVAAALLAQLGASVLPDTPGAGLNAALEHGLGQVWSDHPGGGAAALSADLPALRPAELADALAAAAAAPTAFVCDAEGTGTTLLTAGPGARVQPRFGHRSRAAHRAAGVTELLQGGWPSLRRDVDTEVDLRDAARLGLGLHTEGIAARLLV